MKRLLIVLMLVLIASGAYAQGYMQWHGHTLTLIKRCTATSHTAGDSIYVHSSGLNVTFSFAVDTTATGVTGWFAVNGDSTNKYPIYGSAAGGEAFSPPVTLPRVRYIKLWTTVSVPIRFYLQ
jgi:hypothetical protein